MLIVIISMILSDVDDIRFSQNIIHSIKEQIKRKGEEENQFTFKQNKKEYILNRLCESVKNINLNTLGETRDSVKYMLSKESELKEILTVETNETKYDLSNENSILLIYYKYRDLYANFLKFTIFDERIFLIEKYNTDCSPVKMTPFKRQKVSTIYDGIKKPHAFKALNFDNFNSNQNNILSSNSSNFESTISGITNVFKVK
jgi:hypothetical protein